MELLLALITAHFICDFYLQPSSWIEDRYKNTLQSKALIKHTLIHGLVNCIVLMSFELSALHILTLTSFITLSHYIIDLWKSYRPQTQLYFILDQVLHLTIIVAGCTIVSDNYYLIITDAISSFLQKKNVIYILAYLIACKPISVLLSFWLNDYSQQIDNQQHGLDTAGKWIGYLERCLIITFIIINQFTAIGFLLAAKTIFRFGDLSKNTDMKLTEYMMIGTLFSFSSAIVLGLIIR